MGSQENRNLSQRAQDFVYDPLSIVFHWTIALLVIYQIFLPAEIEGVPVEERAPLVTTHTGIGLIILVLIVFRIVWFLRRDPTPTDLGDPEWQRKLATFVHYAFYALVLLTPLLGFLSTFSAPYEIAPFELFFLNPVGDEETWRFALPSNIHKQFSRVMIGLLAVHAFAALYHQFYLKDGILRRMIPVLPASKHG